MQCFFNCNEKKINSLETVGTIFSLVSIKGQRSSYSKKVHQMTHNLLNTKPDFYKVMRVLDIRILQLLQLILRHADVHLKLKL